MDNSTYWNSYLVDRNIFQNETLTIPIYLWEFLEANIEKIFLGKSIVEFFNITQEEADSFVNFLIDNQCITLLPEAINYNELQQLKPAASMKPSPAVPTQPLAKPAITTRLLAGGSQTAAKTTTLGKPIKTQPLSPPNRLRPS